MPEKTEKKSGHKVTFTFELESTEIITNETLADELEKHIIPQIRKGALKGEFSIKEIKNA